MACAPDKIDPKVADCCHTPEPGLRFYPRLVGRLAYIMAPSPYESGEYFILAQDLYRIDTIKLVVGYNGQTIKRFITEPQITTDKDGKKTVQEAAVLSNIRFAPGIVTDWIVRQYAWGKTPRTKEQRQWIESVYENASEMAETVASILDAELAHRREMERQIKNEFYRRAYGG